VPTGPVEPAPRPYELRVTPIADPRARREVARRLAGRFPAQEPASLVRVLESPGFVGRLALREAEGPAVMRELYEAGAPPAAVILVPVELLGGRRGGAEPADSASFALFTRHGGRFVPTWNWAAFLFGPLWYLRKGLWAKGLVILVATASPFWPLPIWIVVSLVLFVYCGAIGNWDYYLLRVKRTQWW